MVYERITTVKSIQGLTESIVLPLDPLSFISVGTCYRKPGRDIDMAVVSSLQIKGGISKTSAATLYRFQITKTILSPSEYIGSEKRSLRNNQEPSDDKRSTMSIQSKKSFKGKERSEREICSLAGLLDVAIIFTVGLALRLSFLNNGFFNYILVYGKGNGL